MAITVSKTFGEKFAGVKTPSQQTDDRPKAEFWMNIGYVVDYETDEGTEQRFVSLPTGIPLDTQEKLTTTSRNVNFAAFQGARNDLLDQVMEACKGLAPGEDKIIGEAGGLQIQIRRANGEVTPVAPSENPFRRKLALVD